jgi:hypothetical protein
MESRQHEIEMITDKLAEKGSERTLSGPAFVRPNRPNYSPCC